MDIQFLRYESNRKQPLYFYFFQTPSTYFCLNSPSTCTFCTHSVINHWGHTPRGASPRQPYDVNSSDHPVQVPMQALFPYQLTPKRKHQLAPATNFVGGAPTIHKDCEELQNDINKIYQLSKTWEMEFNAKKFNLLEMGKKCNETLMDVQVKGKYHQ